MPWQLQEARQKFSQLVKRALAEGPQAVTRHGETVVVVVSAEDFQRLAGDKRDFADFLLSGPDLSAIEIERSTDRSRDVVL
ncbi:MAG: type II toxin-antitoxin system Phd/YefM family antitoxin [Dehalococcoidia bacterium]|nr:type II toxin-antitoxin system Phd/YefM family antitoxin [Dehalococcoidia bacterium]